MNNNNNIFDNVRICTSDSIFLNSDVLFVEYSDIIRHVNFSVLVSISRICKRFENIFDINKILGLTDTSLWEFYYNRDYQNVLFDLLPNYKIGEIENETIDSMLNDLITAIGDEGIRISPNLNFANVLYNISNEGDIVKKIVVWYPYNNSIIENDIKQTYPHHVDFIYGPIDDVLRDLSGSITYVFSDITNVLLLKELDKLNLSSILVPYHYMYNELNGKCKVDIDYLLENNVFKFNFFDNYA